MMFGTLTIFACGSKAEIKQMNKDDGKAMADHIRARLNEPKSRAASTSALDASAQSDVMTQLRQLAGLRDAGVLTPDEFEAKKTELLGRL